MLTLSSSHRRCRIYIPAVLPAHRNAQDPTLRWPESDGLAGNDHRRRRDRHVPSWTRLRRSRLPLGLTDRYLPHRLRAAHAGDLCDY